MLRTKHQNCDIMVFVKSQDELIFIKKNNYELQINITNLLFRHQQFPF